MDRGYVKGCTTAGVYVGEQFKDRVMIDKGGPLSIGELVGVLVTLERCPQSCNLEIVVDCTSTIATISGYEGWGMGRQMHTEGRGVIKLIVHAEQCHRDVSMHWLHMVVWLVCVRVAHSLVTFD